MNYKSLVKQYFPFAECWPLFMPSGLDKCFVALHPYSQTFEAPTEEEAWKRAYESINSQTKLTNNSNP